MENKAPNKNEENFEAKDNALIENALAPLKALKTPPGLRTLNRDRINKALTERINDNSRARIPLWRRRISIPFPVAAVFAVFFCSLLFLQLSQMERHPEASKATNVAIATAKPEEPHYYEKALYVRGIGFINQEHGYKFFEENNHEIN